MSTLRKLRRLVLRDGVSVREASRRLGISVSGALNPRKSGVGKQSVAVIRGSQLTALNFL